MLPLAQLLVEEVDVVADAAFVEQLVELLVVDAMRPFDFPVEARCSRTDVDVVDVEFLQVPVNLGLELGPIVGLNDVNSKRQTANNFVGEANGRGLVASVVDLQD